MNKESKLTDNFLSYNLTINNNQLPYSRENSEIGSDEEKKEIIYSSNRKWVLAYMCIVTSAYLCDQALEVSKLISNSSHFGITSYLYVYDLLYTWLITYFLIKIGNITSKNKPNLVLVFIFTHLGGLGFALLGELPALKNIAIVPGFWKHLTEGGKITLIIGLFTFLILGFRQAVRSFRDKDCLNHIVPYLVVLTSYIVVLVCMSVSNAKDINIHVHHAIFAGLLSLWFTDWNSCISTIVRSILIGVVIEGLDFYGIGELSLFLGGHGTNVTFNIALGIACAFVFINMILLCIYKKI